MMLYCSKPGDFEPPHIAGERVSVYQHGDPPYTHVDAVVRQSPDGELCLVAMNMYAMLSSPFEVFIARGAL